MSVGGMAYVLWQHEEIARRTYARLLSEEVTGIYGTSEEEARALAGEGGSVILIGAPDFFPERPFPVGTRVLRIKPHPGEDPDELEPALQRVWAGEESPEVETDARAVEEAPAVVASDPDPDPDTDTTGTGEGQAAATDDGAAVEAAQAGADGAPPVSNPVTVADAPAVTTPGTQAGAATGGKTRTSP